MTEPSAADANIAKLDKTAWRFSNRFLNPSYGEGVKTVPLRSCLIHDNAEKSEREIKTLPKWITVLNYAEVDPETGEIVRDNVPYETNEIKSSNGRKIKALDKFCDYYQPLYQSRKVSLTFHTFTRANYANTTFRKMLDNVKYHYAEMLDREVRGFIWTAEVSQQLHWHYHLCVAIDRVRVREIPPELKFEQLWGQRTGVEFVKRDIRRYMAKYFAKENARIIGNRAYGCSRKYT